MCLHRLRPLFSDATPYQNWIDYFTEKFLPGVAAQSRNHDNHIIPSIKEYLEHRQTTFAADIMFPFLESDIPLPPQTRKPLRRFADLASIMMGIENVSIQFNKSHRALPVRCIVPKPSASQDVYSYNKEQADGDTHNIVAVVMHNLHLSLDAAIDWVEAEHARIAREFVTAYKNLPSLGSKALDNRARQWIEDLGYMIRGNVEWSLESPRYFKKDASIKQNWRVALLLPSKASDKCPMLGR